MASQWLKARQTKYAAYATTYTLLVIAVVVVANMLADRYHKSYDATSNKRYSLSDQTAKIVKGLKQDATISYFDQSTRFREGRDLLDQYANLSRKLRVEYVDPDKNPQRAREAGIRSFGTAVVQIGVKREEAKSMTEEGITGAFARDFPASRTFWPRTITQARPSTCSRKRKSRATAPLWWSLGQPETMSNRKWTPSRNMSRMAVAPCSCWTLPLNSVARKSPTTTGSRICSRPGA